jgi:hypothetical protein
MKAKHILVILLSICMLSSLLMRFINNPLVDADWKVLYYKDPTGNYMDEVNKSTEEVDVFMQLKDSECVSSTDFMFSPNYFNTFYDDYDTIHTSHKLIDRGEFSKKYAIGSHHYAYVDLDHCVYYKYNPYIMLRNLLKCISFLSFVLSMCTLLCACIKVNKKKCQYYCNDEPNSCDLELESSYV